MTDLEFFYDFSCPYAYLASTQVEALAARAGARLVMKPFLLGGVFRSFGDAAGPMRTHAAPRARLNGLDMLRWAEHWGVPLNMPAGHPNRTVTALRATLASGDIPRATRALFAAYWVEARDLSQPDVVAGALVRAGFDGAALVARADDPAVKQELRERTDEAIARGVFGAPALFVRGELYWGQDRLEQVGRALGLPPDPPPPATRGEGRRVEFWYDFSSPFAYLASTRIEAVARRHDAELVWRPFLLGGLFREIGTPDVPLASFPAPKERTMRRDMERFAADYAVPFRFPSRFPMRTVTALRLAVASGPRIAETSHALFRAYWADDRDISDPDELARLCGKELVDRASDQDVKRALLDAGREARELGLCGAPTFRVGETLYWGQDRLLFVEKALEGWVPRAG